LYEPIPYTGLKPPTDEQVIKSKNEPKNTISDQLPSEDDKSEDFGEVVEGDDHISDQYESQEITDHMLIELACMKFLSKLPPDSQLEWFNGNTIERDKFLQGIEKNNQEPDPYNLKLSYNIPQEIIKKYKALRGI
jgi:hypothetical protein